MRQLAVRHQLATTAIPDVEVLLDAATTHDGRPALSDHLRLDLVNGGTDGFVALLLRSSPTDHLIAYAQVSRGNDEYLVEIVVHPEHRRESVEIDRQLLDAAVEAIATQGGGAVSWWVHEPTEDDRQTAAGAGLGEGRVLLQMRRPLPLDVSATVETRAFRPGDDDEHWLTVNNRAFADHGEQGGWTLETLRQRIAEDWFDPDGFRIHEHEGRLAAFCWTKVHPPTGDDGVALGEIYVIAVDPDFHGRGLGKQLTLAGLDSLSARGITVAMLYVDHGNTAARTLYERLGFEVHTTDIAFVADISPTRPDPPDPSQSDPSHEETRS